MAQAVRDRVEVSEGDGVWHVTAGSFDSALAYARERFGEVTVLARQDRNRWWPRVTLTVTTDPRRAAGAPPLEALARPAVPEQRAAPGDTTADTPADTTADTTAGAAPDPARDPARGPAKVADPGAGGLPPSLEAIFARQDPQ